MEVDQQYFTLCTRLLPYCTFYRTPVHNLLHPFTLYKPACVLDLTMPSLAFNHNTDPGRVSVKLQLSIDRDTDLESGVRLAFTA